MSAHGVYQFQELVIIKSLWNEVYQYFFFFVHMANDFIEFIGISRPMTYFA